MSVMRKQLCVIYCGSDVNKWTRKMAEVWVFLDNIFSPILPLKQNMDHIVYILWVQKNLS